MPKSVLNLANVDSTTLAKSTLVPFGDAAQLLSTTPETLQDWIDASLIARPFQMRPGGPKVYTLWTIQQHIAKRQRARYVKPKPRGFLVKKPTLKANKSKATSARKHRRSR